MNNTGIVKITIKYLVNLSEKAGLKEEEVSFPKGSTLHDVSGYLKDSRNIIIPSTWVMAVLNGKGWEQHPDKWDTVIADGDIILLFPPISGG